MIPPIPSSIIATVYCFALATLSTVQFFRSRTPLRLGAAVMAIFGLSIAALSIVYAAQRIWLSVFWVYQFLAECISLTWVITTIIHLGYAFYPLTRHQTFIWRTALGSVLLYDAVAIAELSYYCYAVFGSGTLTREATPVLWIYWVRQVVKVITCAVTIAYLFVPLVRHHHNTGVAMIADSNTLAVGTWYLSSLGVTSLGYFCMFIYYMTKSKAVFDPQAQNLDLCIRLIACPIFSLPPPRILLVYFQEKYGTTVRDDNPNTMIEEGITNDPRPRRPAMLINLPSNSARRNSEYMFDHPSRRTTGAPLPPLYPTQEQEEVRYKHWEDEEVNIGLSMDEIHSFPSTPGAASTVDTARSRAPNGQSTTTTNENSKESQPHNLDPTASHILSALSISGLSGTSEPPRAPKKISRRLTSDVLPSLMWDLTASALTSTSLPTPTEITVLTNVPSSKRVQRSKIGGSDGGSHGSDKMSAASGVSGISSTSILEESERISDENPPRSQAHSQHEGLQDITSSVYLDSVRVASREAITRVAAAQGNSTGASLRHGSTLGPLSPTMLRATRGGNNNNSSSSISLAESGVTKSVELGPLGAVESLS
ncbi:hypothetical protein BGZ83_011566 [Gryganskiella cystojenkinii]|nr:hypothetical protein BGZ83_011566 [Gryganskiella cystojenkinii]